MSKRLVRRLVTAGVSGGLAILIALGLAPQPVKVDLGAVERAAMRVTLDEEGRTRVGEIYVVSAPTDGRLLRVDLEPGDSVVAGRTVVARLQPTPPSMLDARARRQAQTAVVAAEAVLAVAEAELHRAEVDQDLADAEVQRAQALSAQSMVSESILDQAIREARVAAAEVQRTRARVALAEAERDNAQAQLIDFDDVGARADEAPIALTAPVTGQVLRVLEEQARPVSAGTDLVELGDINNDLEIVAELLSTDAVRVRVGQRVLVEKWGGGTALEAVVERVEPRGFTKFSALGVEEQRVNVIIGFAGEAGGGHRLGHGFRVQVRVVVWERDAALTVPSSALFRIGDGWAVFTVDEGSARQVGVEIGHNNGVRAHVRAGLRDGQTVVLFPGPEVVDGVRVQPRTAD